jgi:hypothetical protein
MIESLTLQNETFMPVFEEIMDWQLNVVRRHAKATFAVLVVEPNLLSTSQDSYQWSVVMTEFHKSLRQVIRTSDLSAFGNGNEVWLLLPHSDASGALARLRILFASAGTGLSLKGASINLRHGDVLPDSAVQLIGDLRQSLTV